MIAKVCQLDPKGWIIDLSVPMLDMYGAEVTHLYYSHSYPDKWVEPETWVRDVNTVVMMQGYVDPVEWLSEIGYKVEMVPVEE